MMSRLIAALICAMLWPVATLAQVGPSSTEVAHYQGIHLAAHQGDLDEIRRLIAQGDDLEARDGRGRTPVHIAAFASHEEVIALLAAAGADMNALEGQAYDAVTIAAVANDIDMLSAALNAGNRADLITSPYIGTALIAAAHLGHAEVVRVLLAAGAPSDHINNLGWTALIEAVILGDGGPAHIETVRALLDAGADKSIADGAGTTPQMHAKARGYTEIEALIAQAAE
jgi:ankyrin repeat protein